MGTDVAEELERLIAAPSWTAAADIVDGCPDLLRDEVLEALGQMLASPELDDIHAATIDDLRRDLRACVTAGTSAPLRQRAGVHWSVVWTRFAGRVSEAYAAHNRFRASGDLADLEEAEDLWRRIQDDVDVESTPEGFRLLVLDGVAATQLARFTALGDEESLDAGVATAGEAADRTPADGHFRGRRLTNLSGGLLARAQLRGDPADLRAGTEAANGAVEDTDPSDPLWPGRVNNLVAALTQQAEDDPAGRARALEILDQAVERAAADPTTLGRLLHARGNIFRQLYQQDDRVETLNEAVDAFAAAVEKGGRGHPDAGMFLSDWALCLGVRFEERGDRADLDNAIDAARSAVDSTSEERPGLSDYLAILGMLLRTRFAAADDRADLSAAVDAYRASWVRSRGGQTSEALQRYGNTLQQLQGTLQEDLDRAPVEDRAGLLRSLGDVTLDLHAITRDSSVLDDAIAWYERSVDEARGGAQVTNLTRLTLAVRTRAREGGSRADYDRAVDTAREVLRREPDRAGSRNNLGLVLADRYRAFRDVADLTESIGLMRAEADRTAATDPDAPGVVSNLVALLIDHAARADDRASLDEAIERGLAVPQRPGVVWLTLAASTAEALVSRSAIDDSAEDVNQALELCWSATDRGRARSAAHAGVFNALGGALRARYWREGDVEDLEQAIGAYHVASSTDAQAAYLGNLGSMLRVKYLVTGTRGDLDESLEVLADAVERARTEPGEQALALMNLGVALVSRFDEDADRDDLEQGIEHLRSAVVHPDAPPAVRRGSSVNLAAALLRRVDELDDPSVLDEAVGLLTVESPGASWHPRASVLLGQAYRSRHERSGRPEDLAEGVRHLQDAVRRGLDSDLEVALRGASLLTEWALSRRAWDEACHAAQLATQASERALRVQMDAGSKEHWLRLAGDVPVDGAYALARAGRFDDALDAIEHGRARLLAEALEMDRADIERLPELGHDDLYRRFRTASQRLSAEVRAATADPSLGARAVKAASLRSTREQFDEVVAEIRAIPGFGTLLQPMSRSDLAEACAGAPLVYLMVTGSGGLALVATPDPADPAVVRVVPIWLDDIDRESLREQLVGADGQGGSGYVPAQVRYRNTPHAATARATWFDTLDRVTEWVWDRVMGPLVEGLSQHDVPVPNGVVLVPAGLLGILPLHAAWTRTADGGRRYVADTLSVRYAANARAVFAARDRLSRLGAPRLLLAVDPQPVTAAGPLPAASEEAVWVLHNWGEGDGVKLWHDEVTPDAVTAALADHTVFHFAGHAFADWADPARGGLLLAHDEVLTVHQLSRSRLELRLAVLSACETGIPGARVPNEVIGLPTALVQAGACGVIASLWPVPDQSTSRLMDHVYRFWREEGAEPPEALRLAQAAMRSEGKLHMHHWAAFGFTGV